MTDDELADKMSDVYYKDGVHNLSMWKVLQFVREHDAKHRPAEAEKPRRVPVQIAVGTQGGANVSLAMANDGTVWRSYEATAGLQWRRLPDLPQD